MLYFVFADTHGDYEAFSNFIRESGYDRLNTNHQLIGLGDYFGRASQSLTDSKNMWEYLSTVEHINPPVCLKGNHEQILIDAIDRGWLTPTDIYNGELETFASFGKVYAGQLQQHPTEQTKITEEMRKCGFYDWLVSLPSYHITNNCIYVHGFLPHQGNIEHEPFVVEQNQLAKLPQWLWDAAAWSRTINDVHQWKRDYPNGIGKWIVFGHWRASQLITKTFGEPAEDGEPFVDNDSKLVGLDYTTVLSRKVGWAIFDDNGFLKQLG